MQTFMLGIISGLGLGAVYAVTALAFNLVLAASGVFNLALGATITVSVLISYELTVNHHMNTVLIIVIVMALGAVSGSLSELISVRRFLRNTRSLSHETMVSTYGLGLAGTSLAAVFFGADIQPVPDYLTSKSIVVGGFPIRPIYIAMLVVAVVLTVAIELVLHYTEVGTITRAVIADPEGASATGINVARVVQTSFIIAGAFGGLAGFLIAPVLSAQVTVGDSVQLFGFGAIVIGGFASIRGSLIGGLIVGLVAGITPVFVQTAWSLPVVYVIVIAVLFIRPAGLFGRAGLFGSVASRQV